MLKAQNFGYTHDVREMFKHREVINFRSGSIRIG